MKAIVVPVDFSPVSMNAVHYATNLALSMGTDIVLLNTFEMPLTFTEVPVAAITVDELADISRKRLEGLKSSLEHLTSSRLKVYCESRLGSLIIELEDVCKRLKPFAVVMGTKGHGRVHDLLIGGNTLNAMRRVDAPIIVVPAGVVFKTPTRVGLACDLNDVVDTLPAGSLKEILGWFDSKLYVLNVRSGDSVVGETQHSESLMLDTLLSGMEPEYRFLEGEDVAETVRVFAEENELDWIIVVPKIHRGLSELLHRSISRDLAYQSHAPLVSLHA